MKFITTFLLVSLSFTANSQSVIIGTQEWMTKNLDVTKFRNGDPIPQAKTAQEWDKAYSAKQPAWCYYDNNVANGPKFGKLFNWYAVNDPRGLAPEGWHIPSDTEWMQLIRTYGDTRANSTLKNSTGWHKNSNGTNASGFTGLPGGCRGASHFEPPGSKLSDFSGVTKYGLWWSATSYDEETSYYLQLAFFDISVNLDAKGFIPTKAMVDKKGKGMSVRCIKD